jgi:hypothetical protein
VLTETPVRDVRLACGATDMRKSIDGLNLEQKRAHKAISAREIA